MDALFANAGGALLTYGPGGIIALLAILALIVERKEKNSERNAHVETLKAWRTDTQSQADKVSALAEKVIVTIETLKRGS